MNLLELALYLSVLSYVLGLLIRALPIPFMSIKRLGRSLVVDGVFSAILVFSYRILLYSIDYMGKLLGSNWDEYFNWLALNTLDLIALIGGIKTLGILMSKIGLDFFANSFLAHITSLAVTSLTTLLVTTYMSSILYRSSQYALALGLVLHSVPFRLTRSVGATLIAVVLVFSVGLPLMPVVVNTFSSIATYPMIPHDKVCSGYIKLLDTQRKPVGYAVIEGYSGDELLYRYVVDKNGVLSIDLASGLPCFEHDVLIQLVDLYFTTHISLGSERTWNITLVISGLYYIAPYSFIYISGNHEVLDYSVDKNWFNITVTPGENNVEIYIYWSSESIVQVYMDNSLQAPIHEESIEWYGVNITRETYILPSGIHTLSIRGQYRASKLLQVDIYTYTTRFLSIDPLNPESIVLIATSIFLKLTVMPIVYVSMLFMISLSLARLLGGASMAIARRLV